MDTCVIDPGPSEKRYAPRQFSLRGLLWFVVACSAYLSQFQPDLFTSSPLGDGWEQVGWHGVSTVMVPWLLLAAFYVRTRLHPAFAVHCAGPVLALTITMLLVISEPDEFRNPGKNLGMAPVSGCFVSTTISFPVSVLMMVVSVFSRNRTETK